MPAAIQLLSDRAYRLVLDMILSGEIPPDAPLSERKRAERLDMGRTPVREALRALARDGVVEARLARGTFVRQLSLESLREVYQVRQALEGAAAGLAARHGPTRELSAFGPWFREMAANEKVYKGTEIDDAGAEFHLEIFRAARNDMLFQVFEPLRLRFQLAFGLPRHHDLAGMRESLADHLRVLEAIEGRDEALARQLMCEHLERGLEVRTRIFEQMALPSTGRRSPNKQSPDANSPGQSKGAGK
jgi:DNA-binding GntR family transcriptional regulator